MHRKHITRMEKLLRIDDWCVFDVKIENLYQTRCCDK